MLEGALLLSVICLLEMSSTSVFLMTCPSILIIYICGRSALKHLKEERVKKFDYCMPCKLNFDCFYRPALCLLKYLLLFLDPVVPFLYLSFLGSVQECVIYMVHFPP